MTKSQHNVVSTLDEISALLSHGNEFAIHTAICDGIFDGAIAGLQIMSFCSQGVGKHLEGDVAKHSAKVVSSLVAVSSEDPHAEFDSIDLVAVSIPPFFKHLLFNQ